MEKKGGSGDEDHAPRPLGCERAREKGAREGVEGGKNEKQNKTKISHHSRPSPFPGGGTLCRLLSLSLSPRLSVFVCVPVTSRDAAFRIKRGRRWTGNRSSGEERETEQEKKRGIGKGEAPRPLFSHDVSPHLRPRRWARPAAAPARLKMATKASTLSRSTRGATGLRCGEVRGANGKGRKGERLFFSLCCCFLSFFFPCAAAAASSCVPCWTGAWHAPSTPLSV